MKDQRCFREFASQLLAPILINRFVDVEESGCKTVDAPRQQKMAVIQHLQELSGRIQEPAFTRPHHGDDRSGEFSSCSRNESGRRGEATEGHAAVQFNAINVESCGQPDIFNAACAELQQNGG